MKDDEIREVKCNACGCAIVPELHEARSGEYHLSFFVCPYCQERYIVSVTDEELRKGIGEYSRLKEAIEEDRLPEEGKRKMAELKKANRQRAIALKEALGYGNR